MEYQGAQKPIRPGAPSHGAPLALWRAGTARLARPIAPHEVPPLPTDWEINDPSNVELFLLGKDSASASDGVLDDGKQNVQADRGPSGSTGFAR